MRTNTSRIHDTLLLGLALALPLAWLMTLNPIVQDPSYHNFADQSLILGIPHFFDVVSNAVFLFAGIFGLKEGVKRNFPLSKLVFIVAVVLVAPGSVYYHWTPNNETLLWDRLPMVIAFCSLSAWILAAYFNPRLEKPLLAALNLIGLSSLAVWVLTEDLRFYYWVQLSPVLLLLYLGLFKRGFFKNVHCVFAAFVSYALAKLVETYDVAIFNAIGLGGHSLKHLLAAAAVYFLVLLEIGPTSKDSL